MQITISTSGQAQLPSVNRSAITLAIRSAIRAGKSTGSQVVKQRYTARSMLSLGKISAKASGMRGTLTISGRRNLIKKFRLSPKSRPPHKPSGGLHVQIVRGQGGNLPHAFVNRAGIVFENVGGRKLKHLSTVSLPGAFERIGDKLIKKMEIELMRRLENVL